MSQSSRKRLATNPPNPFDPNDRVTYAYWRDEKLEGYPRRLDEIFVDVLNPWHLSAAERAAIQSRIRAANMALYATPATGNPDKSIPREIARQMGMVHLDRHLCVDEDGISPIRVSEDKVRQDYIPYTSRPINWHTDGYYHPPGHAIRGMVLHCVNTAICGGENSFVDHEIIYIMLRDMNPDFIRALMQADAMTIPANIHNGEMIRPAVTGPVFSVESGNPQLHMRYTAREHHIQWKQDSILLDAVAALNRLLTQSPQWIFHHRLTSGQGIICNNVLHKRNGFVDGTTAHEKRLLYRARYHDRIER